jgi:hypothetical protein
MSQGISALTYAQTPTVGVSYRYLNDGELTRNPELAELAQIRRQVESLGVSRTPSAEALSEPPASDGFFMRLAKNPTTWKIAGGLATAVLVGVAMANPILGIALGAAVGAATEPLIGYLEAKREGRDYTLGDALKDGLKGAAIGAVTVGLGSMISRGAGMIMSKLTGCTSQCVTKCFYYLGSQVTALCNWFLGGRSGPQKTPSMVGPSRMASAVGQPFATVLRA